VSGHIITSPAAKLIGAMLDIPFVQYLYASEIAARPHLTAFAVRSAAAIVAISRHTETLALAAGAPPHRIHRIPPGIDLPQRIDRLPVARPTLLTVASLAYRFKGHDVLARAMPLIAARVPDVEWVVVGDGPLRAQVERLAYVHGAMDHVRFAGLVADDEREAWFRRAHVFAMPSRLSAGGVGGEGFGIVYLEAASYAIPVVAGNVGGALDAVVGGETGVLIDPTDHVSVAHAISDLLLDDRRAAELGHAAAARARRFAWPVIASRVEELRVHVSECRA
jgi:phosphatidyl-myo-inositol dimannoside synthase